MKRFFAVAFFLSIGISLYAQSDDVLNADKNHLALNGYDVVSYFDNSPTEGLEYLNVNYEGATYYFVTAHNKALFEKSPEKYLPEYGGWCAFGMGKKGVKLEIDPLNYKVLDGKLYLFFKNKSTNALELWNQKETEYLPKANENWANITE